MVKTIGDEIMSRFPTANDAAGAACSIHETMRSGCTGHQTGLSVRIGMHFGDVLPRGNDVYGDAVNVAARVASVSMANQIVTTLEFVRELAPEMSAKVREFDRISLKGKSGATSMYEIMWEQDDITHMPAIQVPSEVQGSRLRLTYAGKDYDITSDSPTFVIGRSPQSHLNIPDKIASRLHAKIEYRRGKFVLTDHSTNGTYVRNQQGQEMFLRREEIPLVGNGVIAIGESFAAAAKHQIHYTIVQSEEGTRQMPIQHLRSQINRR